MNYSRLMGSCITWKVLLRTFEISFWVVVITFVIGYPLAYVMTFVIKSRVLRRLFYIVVVVPLFTSNIVRAFGWMVLLGRKGLTERNTAAAGPHRGAAAGCSTPRWASSSASAIS